MGGPEQVSVRALAQAFAERFGLTAKFKNTESGMGWHNDTSLAAKLFGYPEVPLARMIDWTTDWIEPDQPHYNLPTHYEARDGAF